MSRRPRRKRFDGGTVWPFLISFAAHAALLGLLLAAPNRYLAVSSPIGESYTVDLISPDAIGGDSGPLGPGSEPDLEPAVVAELAQEPESQPEVEPEPEPEPEPPVEVEAEPETEVEAAVVPEPEPQLETEPEPDVVVAAVDSPAAATATLAPPPTVAKPTAKPTAAPAKPTAVPVKATAAPTKPAVPTKAAPTKPAAAPTAKASPRPAPPTPDPAAERDRRIAEAIKQRAAAAGQPSAEEKIAEAVARRAQQLGGGGSGVAGPLSTGPGTGAGGGTIIGAEYILFKRRMEARIREAWVWAGAQDHLESVVRFSVAPEGEIGNVRTTRSSGDPAYDASAERAVRAASPLGMVPEAYRQEFADVELTFRARDLQR